MQKDILNGGFEIMNSDNIPDELKGVADQYQKDMDGIDEQDEEIRRKQREARTVSLIESRDNCIECGLEIPSARQIAIPGVETCVGCQSVAEMTCNN